MTKKLTFPENLFKAIYSDMIKYNNDRGDRLIDIIYESFDDRIKYIILSYYRDGLTYSKIGDHLNMGDAGVQYHVKKTLRKLLLDRRYRDSINEVICPTENNPETNNRNYVPISMYYPFPKNLFIDLIRCQKPIYHIESLDHIDHLFGDQYTDTIGRNIVNAAYRLLSNEDIFLIKAIYRDKLSNDEIHQKRQLQTDIYTEKHNVLKQLLILNNRYQFIVDTPCILPYDNIDISEIIRSSDRPLDYQLLNHCSDNDIKMLQSYLSIISDNIDNNIVDPIIAYSKELYITKSNIRPKSIQLTFDIDTTDIKLYLQKKLNDVLKTIRQTTPEISGILINIIYEKKPQRHQPIEVILPVSVINNVNGMREIIYDAIIDGFSQDICNNTSIITNSVIKTSDGNEYIRLLIDPLTIFYDMLSMDTKHHLDIRILNVTKTYCGEYRYIVSRTFYIPKD